MRRLFWIVLALGFAGAALAQSQVFVKNESRHRLRIDPTSLGGATVSAAVWSQGAASVAPGGREVVLTLNRKGKVNWMDPTPRFVEPGKEAVFSTRVSLDDAPGSGLVLLQKLLGTGESTKMWYSVDTRGGDPRWYAGAATQHASWGPDNGWRIGFRSFEENGETHVEYVIGRPK
jgi:hypothetical protein